MQVIGSGKAVIEMLREFGLSEYEAKIYFTLLTLGEVKVTTLTRKACVPQSKAYDVLERLIAKGFAELSSIERPKKYRAKTLKKIADVAISQEEKRIQKLNKNIETLQNILGAISPIYRKYGTLQLFSPKFTRR